MSNELQPILKAMRHAYLQGTRDVRGKMAEHRTDAELNELFSIIAEECLAEIVGAKEKGDE